MAGANLLKIGVLLCLVGWACFSGHASSANLLPLSERRPGSDPIFPAVAGATSAPFSALADGGRRARLPEISATRGELSRWLSWGCLAGYRGLFARLRSVLSRCCPSKRSRPTRPLSLSLAARSSAQRANASYPPACCCVFSEAWPRSLWRRRAFAMPWRNPDFFPAFGTLHPRFGTPANAILLQTGLLAGRAVFRRLRSRAGLHHLFGRVFLSLSAASLFRLEQRVRAWWFPGGASGFSAGMRRD